MTHALSILLLASVLAFAGTGAGPAAPFPDDAGAHDFHVSYGRMAVEGSSIAVRFRFFADDLLRTIRSFTGDEAADLSDDPASWAAFETYLAGSFILMADGDTLGGLLIGSGEEIMDKEPVRWFLVQYTATDTVRAVSLQNRLLFDEFDDQKNIVQFRHFPSEENGSLYFTHDRPSYELAF